MVKTQGEIKQGSDSVQMQFHLEVCLNRLATKVDFSEFKAEGWHCGNVRVSQSAVLECNPELARGLRFVDLG